MNKHSTCEYFMGMHRNKKKTIHPDMGPGMQRWVYCHIKKKA